MTEREIIDKIEKLLNFKSESEEIEVKSASGGIPKIYDTISAFANTRGGIIIFGINEKNNGNFEVVGLRNFNEIQRKISEICSQKMFPSIRPIITQIEYRNKKLLVMEILELNQIEKPCYYIKNGIEKGAYIRVGDSDQRMTKYEIYALDAYKKRIDEDLKIVEQSRLKNLDKRKLEEYIRKIKKEKPKFSKKGKVSILKLSNIVKEKNGEIFPTFAGMMVFGEYPQQFYPQLFIACSIIPGYELGELGKIGERFTDNARIEGNIEEMLEGAMNFLEKNMRIKVVVDSSGRRSNISEYPMVALREAIVNALVHRDYSIYTEKSYIRVFKYKDRIEIESPGTLYGRNRIEQLGTDTMLEVRNSTIVQILENQKSILENRHSGIPTMKSEMLKNDLPEPEFINQRGSFKVIFYNGEGKSDTVEGKSDTVEGKSDTVHKYEFEILEYCKEARSKKEIMAYLNMNSSSYVSRKILIPLIQKGKLQYTNPNKNAKNQKYISMLEKLD
ncbi:RNA-binding domain-containing protein [Fusobacterium necrophorum]|nr:RNA-binding domain-containing protein [Fusobacterium necrophorum]KDE72830.1 ATPase AAA [Fusobacterium necrophorum DJ-2]